MQPTFNNKKVIWESKRKQAGLIALNFLFVAAIIWTRDKSFSFSFWGALIFFGGGGLFFLVRLLNPKNLFVSHDTKLGKEIFADKFQKEQESLGFFTYTEDGFSLEEHSGVTSYKWSDIETVFGFKEDRYTTDEICMDIFTIDNASLRLTESTPGWYRFQKRLSENIPSIPKGWDGEIALPAFETKLTLLFDRKGRTPKEAETACYPK
jgi:hypothetical protein